MAMDYRQLEQTAERKNSAELVDFAASELRAVASGQRVMNAVRHPLGFYCLPVLREGEHGVCVHVFGSEEPASDGPTTSRLHSHSWRLISYVLYGQVGNVTLEVSEDPERPTHRVFEVHSSPSGTDEIRPTSRLVRCVSGPTRLVPRGSMYTLPAGEFHTTVLPDDAGAATLVLGRSAPGLSDLSLGPVHGRGHRVERRMCHTTHTARIARAALGRIHGRHDRA